MGGASLLGAQGGILTMEGKELIACFAPRCGAEEAIILPAGTYYKETEQDDGNWRFILIQGGGQVWVLRAQLTKG